MSDIRKRRADIERRSREEREFLLRDHQLKFSKERAELIADCAREGHARGAYHDNGLGWEWYYCAKCGGRIEERSYLEPQEPRT
jgi:hypothetical protein